MEKWKNNVFLVSGTMSLNQDITKSNRKSFYEFSAIEYFFRLNTLPNFC